MSRALADPPGFADLGSFDLWNGQQTGRWELLDGIPVATAPERLNHARIKFNLASALRAGLRGRGTGCETFGDGPGVRGVGLNSFRPDVILRSGPPLAGNLQFVDGPALLTTIHLTGSVAIDPPGVTLEVDAIYEDTDLPPRA